MDDYVIDGDLAFSDIRSALKFYQEQYHKKKEWVGLTDEEAKKTFEKHNCTISADLAGILARAITAKLKEKNT